MTLLSSFTFAHTSKPMKFRGVVYDVGLQYNKGQYSVDPFDIELVKYDFSIISNILHANAVRIEGEEISRLVAATEVAHKLGLKVFFNPWKINAGRAEVLPYMIEAAKAAEELRQRGVDLVFVAGCEFSLFCDGVFDGTTINERIASLTNIGAAADPMAEMQKASYRLNAILAEMVTEIRKNFHGQITYSSGTWEQIDWSLFDIVGVDYYRDTQTEEEYVGGLRRYIEIGKPMFVMEFGCCAFEGAAEMGGFGFSVCEWATPDSKEVHYRGDVKLVRNETVQADYIEANTHLISDAGAEGLFVFLFSAPNLPYRETGFDADLTAYPIVKTFAPEDPRSRLLPPWQPKEAFYRVAEIYRKMEMAQ